MPTIKSFKSDSEEEEEEEELTMEELRSLMKESIEKSYPKDIIKKLSFTDVSINMPTIKFNNNLHSQKSYDSDGSILNQIKNRTEVMENLEALIAITLDILTIENLKTNNVSKIEVNVYNSQGVAISNQNVEIPFELSIKTK